MQTKLGGLTSLMELNKTWAQWKKDIHEDFHEAVIGGLLWHGQVTMRPTIAEIPEASGKPRDSKDNVVQNVLGPSRMPNVPGN